MCRPDLWGSWGRLEWPRHALPFLLCSGGRSPVASTSSSLSPKYWVCSYPAGSRSNSDRPTASPRGSRASLHPPDVTRNKPTASPCRNRVSLHPPDVTRTASHGHRFFGPFLNVTPGSLCLLRGVFPQAEYRGLTHSCWSPLSSAGRSEFRPSSRR